MISEEPKQHASEDDIVVIKSLSLEKLQEYAITMCDQYLSLKFKWETMKKILDDYWLFVKEE